MAKTEYGLTTRALMDGACGDAGLVVERDGVLFCALIDGVGHGPKAAAIAERAKTYLEGHCEVPLAEALRGLHEALQSTQGAVACLCRLDLASGGLCMSGIGNIVCRIFRGLESERLVSREGILGYMMASPREQTRRLAPQDLLILHSDGVREHFEVFDYPGLLRGPAETVAAAMVEQLGKSDDDASCLAVRFLR